MEINRKSLVVNPSENGAIKAVQISTDDISGGAAMAMYRLNNGLRQIGVDSSIVARNKLSDDQAVLQAIPTTNSVDASETLAIARAIQTGCIDKYRTDLSETYFNWPLLGYDLSNLSVIQRADVLNLHWVSFFQSLSTLHRLNTLKKPIVWTLHDQWAFTGGCHYTAGCTKYQKDCGDCPQLTTDVYNLPSAVLSDKKALFAQFKPIIVTPSRWLAESAKASLLFNSFRIEVIPNSLDTDVFHPIPKNIARQQLELAPDAFYILFGAQNDREKRKGFSHLIEAIRYCLSIPQFRDLVDRKKIQVLCFGVPSPLISELNLPVISFGQVDSEEKINQIYSAADIVALPSLEDNLPNILLEAMSSGTPVVAYEVGGIPDVVTNGENGRLAPLGDWRELGKAIHTMVANPEQVHLMGKNCRQKMEAEFSLRIQADRYQALYKELLSANKRQKGKSPQFESLQDDAKVKREAEVILPEVPVGLTSLSSPASMNQILMVSLKNAISNHEEQIIAQKKYYDGKLEEQKEYYESQQKYFLQVIEQSQQQNGELIVLIKSMRSGRIYRFLCRLLRRWKLLDQQFDELVNKPFQGK